MPISPVRCPGADGWSDYGKEEKTEVETVMQYCREHMEIFIKEKELENVAALKVAMKRLAKKYGCGAIAIQCWNQLQKELGVMPCAANNDVTADRDALRHEQQQGGGGAARARPGQRQASASGGVMFIYSFSYVLLRLSIVLHDGLAAPDLSYFPQKYASGQNTG